MAHNCHPFRQNLFGQGISFTIGKRIRCWILVAIFAAATLGKELSYEDEQEEGKVPKGVWGEVEKDNISNPRGKSHAQE